MSNLTNYLRNAQPYFTFKFPDSATHVSNDPQLCAWLAVK